MLLTKWTWRRMGNDGNALRISRWRWLWFWEKKRSCHLFFQVCVGDSVVHGKLIGRVKLLDWNGFVLFFRIAAFKLHSLWVNQFQWLITCSYLCMHTHISYSRMFSFTIIFQNKCLVLWWKIYARVLISFLKVCIDYLVNKNIKTRVR